MFPECLHQSVWRPQQASALMIWGDFVFFDSRLLKDGVPIIHGTPSRKPLAGLRYRHVDFHYFPRSCHCCFYILCRFISIERCSYLTKCYTRCPSMDRDLMNKSKKTKVPASNMIGHLDFFFFYNKIELLRQMWSLNESNNCAIAFTFLRDCSLYTRNVLDISGNRL